ncbi:MAG: RNA polymerase sigma factor [Bacteroidales bacterium]|nr:RNA polymerase sigma factor [Bacteroidales bacterium]
MEFLEDSLYIEKVLSGDTSACTNLVNKHKDMVFTIARKIARSREDAEEIAQDAFIKAFQSLEKFKQKSKFSTWLYRITYNTAVSRVRKKNIEVSVIDEEVIENYPGEQIYEFVEAMDDQRQQQFIDAALERLSPEDNVVITLFYLEECSIEEISKITALSKSNVKVKLHRIRKRLYKELNHIYKSQFNEVV